MSDVRRKVGSVRQRKDGTWEARLTVNGKRRSYFGRTEAIATAKLDAARRDLDVGLVLAGVLLAHRLGSLSTKGLVFTRDGERPLYGSLVHREWGRWRGDFGGATFHDLRHAAASLWLASGADLKTIQAMLGHSKVEMTGHYTHVLPDGMREAAARVREVMG